jgi:hypothetical protein
MRNLDIGEVAGHCGLPPSTLRYYEEKGLIKSIGRRGLRRVFPAGVLSGKSSLAAAVPKSAPIGVSGTGSRVRR